jgi:type I restriction enzyme R subunit
MQALDRTVELGKRRFLIELPTGCGKTDLIALYLKRLIEAGHAERMLFLVDRDQLAKQAIEAIQDLLPGIPAIGSSRAWSARKSRSPFACCKP